MSAVLLAALLAAAANWDAGLQGADWRRRQQRELRASTAHNLQTLLALQEGGELLPCPRPPTTPALPAELPPEIKALVSAVKAELDQMFVRSNATGGSAVLVYGDRVVLSHGWGNTMEKGGGAVDADTVFGIGSISKVFTDLLMLRAVEDGAITLSTPITDLAPEYQPKWPAGVRATPKGGTLRDLGSHMAGLPRYAPCNFGACNITTETALSRISEWTLLFEPGSSLAYSNTGFALLGRLLERVNTPTSPKGQAWEQSLRTLARLLGMQSTASEPPADRAKLARGYQMGQLVPILDIGFSNPAGGVFSSANDMAKLLSFLVRDGAARNDAIGAAQPLDSATVRRWLHDRTLVNPSNLDCSNCIFYTEWGAPWQTLRANIAQMENFSRFNLMSKDGSVPGYNAQLVIQPELKLGLFAAMSTGESREVPFFSDVLSLLGMGVAPHFYEYLNKLEAQRTRLPPSPEDYEGNYLGIVPGAEIALNIGRSTQGSMGDSVLYALTNVGLGWSPMQPLGVLGQDVLVMLPMPSELCFTIEGGDQWALRFIRDTRSGKVISVEIDGIGAFPIVLKKQG